MHTQRHRAVVVHGLPLDAPVLVQPGTHLAALGRDAQVGRNRLDAETGVDGCFQRVQALAGQGASRQPFLRCSEAASVFDAVDLVPDLDGRHRVGADLGEHGEHFGAQIVGIGCRCVDDVQDQIRLGNLFQRRLERLHQRHRQRADEAHRVREHHFRIRVGQPAHGRVEGGEEAVLGFGVAGREGVEEGGLAGVGVAGEGDRGHLRPGAPASTLGAALLHVRQPRTHLADAAGEHSLVHLQLRLASAPLRGAADLPAGAATACTTCAALPVQVRPAADEPRLRVGELREFHLQLAFVGAGAVGEDVQDEFSARHHAALQPLLQIALLGWR